MTEFYVPPSDLQRTTWDAVAGLEIVKQSLQETAILPLVRPDLFTGLRTPQNILLYGPPGTGKTMLVRAAAHESGSHLFVVTSSAVTSKFMGEAEKLVRTLFQVARELAPCILFLDEMDALLSIRKGDGSEHEASRRMKTEFMVQMDGIRGNANNSTSDEEKTSHHVLLIGCTNDDQTTNNDNNNNTINSTTASYRTRFLNNDCFIITVHHHHFCYPSSFARLS